MSDKPSIRELDELDSKQDMTTDELLQAASAVTPLIAIAKAALAYKSASGRNMSEVLDDEYWSRVDAARMALFDAASRVKL